MADDIVADAKRQVDNRVSGSTPSQDDPLIWVSGSGITVPKRGTLGKNQLKVSEMKQSVLAAAANRDPYFSTLANSLYATNFISKSSRNIPEYVAAGLENAINVYQAYVSTGGDKSFSDWWGGYVQSAPPREDDGGGAYTGPVTTVSTSITDENTAEALLNNMARDLLGRGLTEKETSKYLRQYRQIEEDNPQVTTTQPMGQSRRETVTESAPSKEEMLRQVMAQNPDYQKYQIDTTIMDLLLDDIKAGQEVIRG